jgi:hypothetical protein
MAKKLAATATVTTLTPPPINQHIPKPKRTGKEAHIPALDAGRARIGTISPSSRRAEQCALA